MIVLIDDDDCVRESICILLEVYGYVVRAYASADRFLASDLGEAELLIVDQNMPGTTGVELLELLQARNHPPRALMVTGRMDPTLAARLKRIGVKLVCKPVDGDQLVRWIEEARLTPSQKGSGGASESVP